MALATESSIRPVYGPQDYGPQKPVSVFDALGATSSALQQAQQTRALRMQNDQQEDLQYNLRAGDKTRAKQIDPKYMAEVENTEANTRTQLANLDTQTLTKELKKFGMSESAFKDVASFSHQINSVPNMNPVIAKQKVAEYAQMRTQQLGQTGLFSEDDLAHLQVLQDPQQAEAVYRSALTAKDEMLNELERRKASNAAVVAQDKSAQGWAKVGVALQNAKTKAQRNDITAAGNVMRAGTAERQMQNTADIAAANRESANDRSTAANAIKLHMANQKLNHQEQSELESQVIDLTKGMQKTANSAASMSAIEKEFGFNLEDYDPQTGKVHTADGDVDADVAGINIPGIGRVAWGTNRSAQVRSIAAVTKYMNDVIHDLSGAAVTAPELERQVKAFSSGEWNSEGEMLAALQRFKYTSQLARMELLKGYPPKAQGTWLAQQNGWNFQTVTSDGQPVMKGATGLPFILSKDGRKQFLTKPQN